MAWEIKYTADCEGEWTDASDDHLLSFASRNEAEAWWAAHYRGPDEFGQQAYPTFVELQVGEVIRYDAAGTVSMVWADGEPVRCPTQHDMDTLPVGGDMTNDEVEGLE